MPKVSVIIPVYNAEKTLDRCIKSIQAQTLADWEAICVDDGSPDNCGKMLDEYAKIDPRIKPIHKENGGVASARQAGIEAATGDYAIHCDPDDWVEPDMLESLVNEAERSGADMVICDYIAEHNCSSKYIEQRPSELTARAVEIGLFQQLHGSCCNKLISSAYYSKEAFITGLDIMEDRLYITKLLRHDPHVAYLHKAFYHYKRAEVGSMSTTFTDKRYWQIVNIYRKFLELYSAGTHEYDMLFAQRAGGVSYSGAMAPGIKGEEIRMELGDVNCIIFKLNTSLFRKLIMLATVNGCKPLASILIKFRSQLQKTIAKFH